MGGTLTNEPVIEAEVPRGNLVEGRAPARRDRPAPGLFRTPEALTSAASGLLLATGWAATRLGAPTVGLVFSILAIASGGYFFGRRALAELVEDRRLGTYFLMSLAALAALATGHAEQGAMLVFLTSISEAAQNYTERKTRGSITALMRLAPRTALVVRDGLAEEVPAESLAVGDEFRVRPGEAIATDGKVIAGRSEVDQAPVTGESVPVAKGPGDEVFAGTINGDAALEVRATRTAADNTLARIIAMVEDAQEHKGKSQRFIERFGAVYSPSVLAAALLVGVIPPLLADQPWGVWLSRATVFIVASAPCAMVISIPVALVAALGTAARHGVLIKGGVHLETLSTIRAVALDKTGTLTRGRPEVTDVLSLRPEPGVGPDDVLALAAAIEGRSEHLLASAIVGHARGRGLEVAEVSEFRAWPGRGASARLEGSEEGRWLHVGSPEFFAERGQPAEAEAVERLQGEGKTVVVLGDDDGPIGLIALRDELRPSAREAVRALRDEGIRSIVMLTGDNPRTAELIADECGVDEFHASLRPEDKVEWVRKLTSRHGPVAMVGDGVNDAPALAEAAVGVAMGVAGTDVALETADVALMGDDLARLVLAFRLARRNRRIVGQNLTMATLLIAGLALAAVLGLIALPMAVIGHELSEFLVIGNGLRMLRSVPVTSPR